MLGMVELNLCHFCSDKWRKWARTVFLFFLAFEFEPQVKIPNKNWSTLILSVNDSLICWGWWSSICATFVQTSEENEQALYSYFSSLSSLLYNRTARYQIRLDFQVKINFNPYCFFLFPIAHSDFDISCQKMRNTWTKPSKFCSRFLRRPQIVKPKRKIVPNFCGPLKMNELYLKVIKII